jgi:hypothetical protein
MPQVYTEIRKYNPFFTLDLELHWRIERVAQISPLLAFGVGSAK